MRYSYQHNGQTYNLTVEAQPDNQFTVTIGERTYKLTAQSLANGGWRLLMDSQSHTIYAAAQNDQRFVQVDSQNYTFTVPGSKSTRRAAQTGSAELVAQMPGQVTAVSVQAGEAVTRGQTVMILEAMKMEIRVTAPADGHIQQVLVQQGAVVERGQRLALFEAAKN